MTLPRILRRVSRLTWCHDVSIKFTAVSTHITTLPCLPRRQELEVDQRQRLDLAVTDLLIQSSSPNVSTVSS